MTQAPSAIPTIAIPGESPAGGAAQAASADEFVHSLATNHYENFPVLSWLVPPALRPDFAAVYAYCRTCDDLGDETGVGEPARARSLVLLARWRAMLDECFTHARGQEAEPPSHPVYAALSATIRRHSLAPEPFHHLIDAFQQDQRTTRYQTWEQLLKYCTRSADPVGRIVLALFGVRPEDAANAELVAMSDATCTALQLTNFWQDVRRDLLERDRVYFPSYETGISADDLRAWLDPRGVGGEPANRVRYIKQLRQLVHRTRDLFERGRPLPARLGSSGGRVVWLFGAGGMHVLDLVERTGCTTLWRRPKLSKVSKLGLILRASVMRFGPGLSGGGAR